jgi:hypothetical protein
MVDCIKKSLFTRRFLCKECSSYYWFYGNNHCIFNVDVKWYFDKPMSDMKTGDMQTQQKYIVNDKFVKILEIL